MMTWDQDWNERAAARAGRWAEAFRCVMGPLASLAMVLGVAGCASMAPTYERPALLVPETYATIAAPAAAVTQAAAMGWRDYFVDERLRSLIDQALEHSRDLRSAVLRVDEARAAYRIQRADGLPMVAAGAASLRGRVPVGITGQALEPELVALGVGVTNWELDFWGRVRSLKDAALETYLATDAARRATALSVVTQVADGYLVVRELDERLALARRAVANREESLRVFRRRVDVGVASRLELTQVDVLRQQATALVAQLELARAVHVHALEVLVGASADLSPVSARLDDAAMFQELEPGLPSDLLIQRPDIVAAEHALKAANANISAARAAFFPRISLTGLLGLASAELDGLFDTDSHAWIFSPAAVLPIFDAGRRRAAVDLSHVRREQAVVRYEQAIQAAFRDVSDALSARRWLGDQVGTLRATLDLQAERARLATVRYDAGAVRYLEVLDAERERLAVEQQLVETRRAWLASRVALYAALGGGSQGLTPARPPSEDPNQRQP